jgi:hypothetical protein
MPLTRVPIRLIKTLPFASRSAATFKMGKNNKKAKLIPESHFRLVHPAVSSASPIVDTHTHLASTFELYRHKYPAGEYTTVYDFVRGLYVPAGVQEIVDVWCEAPVRPLWREFADSAVTEEARRDLWGGMGYWFVMGVHPHQASLYDDAVEADMSVPVPSSLSAARADRLRAA